MGRMDFPISGIPEISGNVASLHLTNILRSSVTFVAKGSWWAEGQKAFLYNISNNNNNNDNIIMMIIMTICVL